MGRLLVLLFGVSSYLVFFGTFLYLMGFLANFGVPKNINTPWDGGSVLLNVAFLVLFGVQHTIMARPKFKERISSFINPAIERSVFVLASSLILAGMMWQWMALPEMIWQVENTTGRVLLYALSLTGWAMVFVSTFLINHFDLFGLRQVVLYFQNKPYAPVPYVERGFYKHIRHPLMFGFMLAFWATPDMSQGHLLFAAIFTCYIGFGLRVEERDLVKLHGDSYRSYQARVPMLIPFLKTRKSA